MSDGHLPCTTRPSATSAVVAPHGDRQLRFTKMHGLGNDFVVLDATRAPVALSANDIRFLANRHFGVGCDQVLLVEPPQHPDADFRYRIFNADGGEVEQCGNGVRCFARYVREHGLTAKNEIVVETAAGLVRPRIEGNGEVTVDMGLPRWAPAEVPFVAETAASRYDLIVGERVITVGVASMGNPHAVTVVDSVARAPVAELGPLIEHHARFPQRVNAGFMEIVNRRHIRLRVYERGTGETLACGTGACAAVVVGRRQGLLESEVAVDLPGGRLRIRWEADDQPVWMTGPAAQVFEGEVTL